jgi:hypothetical protein
MKGMKRKRETLRKKERERERSHFPYRYKRSDEPVAKKMGDGRGKNEIQ